MPVDFCHPTAPHHKLKLPEWCVSSLMMDRALDAVVRRVKKFEGFRRDQLHVAARDIHQYIRRHQTPGARRAAAIERKAT
jgi:hypothetical protein